MLARARSIPTPAAPMRRRSTTSPMAPTGSRSSSRAPRGAYGFGLAAADARYARRAAERRPARRRTRRSNSTSARRRRIRRSPSPPLSSGAAPIRLRSTSRFGLDPLGAFARSGRAQARLARDARGRWAEAAAALDSRGFAGPFVAADARCVHEAGGSPAQELAFALSRALRLSARVRRRRSRRPSGARRDRLSSRRGRRRVHDASPSFAPCASSGRASRRSAACRRARPASMARAPGG